MNWIVTAILSVIVLILFAIAKKRRRQRRLNYIERYYFHKGIRKKVSAKHPHLDEQQLDMVFNALKQYFKLCFLAKKQMVAMPSQVVDDAWHEFILSTRFYIDFCNKALGRFLHHTPTEAMASQTYAQQGIKRAWRLACAFEQINPKHPESLPLLFAIDGLLKIENGFLYHLNCIDANNSSNSGFCASHIGCTSDCAGDTGGDSGGLFGSSCFGDFGFGDGGDAGGCGSDCGGGCGGD